jgi:hypothetical protein
MSRTTISISEVTVPGTNPPQQVRMFHLAAWPPGSHYPNAHNNNTGLKLSPLHPPFTILRTSAPGAHPGVVHQCGNDLMSELNTNPEVRAAIGVVASHPAQNGARPIFFEICCDFAEEFPWESIILTPPADYFACRTLSPVGRLAKSTKVLQMRTLDQPSPTVPPTLRVLAVLAAHGISSVPEFDALYAARGSAGRSGLFAVELDVFVSDQADEAHALRHLPQNAVRMLTAKQDLLDRLRDFRPHLLHFFCHGSAVPAPHLELATQSSRKGFTSPIDVTPDDLSNRCQGIALNPWLAVLSCCDGANAAASQSFARLLLGPEFPVVVGMTEPIDHLTAHSFCGAFHAAVIDLILCNFPLAPAGAAVGPARTVEWVEAMTPARRTVLESRSQSIYSVSLAGDYKWWCLPALYTVEGAFPLAISNQSTAAAVATLTQAQAATALAGVPGMPPALVTELAAATAPAATRAL